MAKPKAAVIFPLERVRNIGIAAHVDAGKTTLTERVLFYTGASYKIGEVHDGSAHMDWQAEEQEHGITITAAVTQCPWKDHLIQIIDTPGHVDFTIEVERAMRVLDGAVIVMDGVRGVEPQTETVWRQANRFDVPRALFINKMDRPGADYDQALESVVERLHSNVVPVCVPMPETLRLLHIIEERAYSFSGDNGEEITISDLTADEMERVAEYRETLLMSLSEYDDDLAEVVLMDEVPDQDMIWSALRNATFNGQVRPAFGGSALKNWGVQPMLDALLKIMPNPLQRPPSTGVLASSEAKVPVEMNKNEPLVALAFKVQLFEGRRHVFVRLYRGTMVPGMEVIIGGTGQKERISRIFGVSANKKTRIDKAVAGQIVLLAGLRNATTGDTLCALEEPMTLESIHARDPVLGLAIEPESSKDAEKVLQVLNKVTEEDPTLRFEEDEETGQSILSGMGELHLQITFERLKREFGLSLRVGKPRVVHRESISKSVTITGGVDRVLDAGENRIELKAHCEATVSPRERGAGVHVTVEPQWCPDEFEPSPEELQSIKDGATDAMSGGPLEGAPLEDVEIIIERVDTYGASTNLQALRIAAASAVRDALAKAGPVLLQPVMKVEVVVPEENVGSVLGDLQARGALIMGHQTTIGMATIDAECGLTNLLGYATALRSQTKGKGQFVMEFHRFDSV